MAVAGVLTRPSLASLLKSRGNFSLSISERASISYRPQARNPSGASIARAAASSTELNISSPKTQKREENDKPKEKVELACPVCYRPLAYSGSETPNLLTVKKSKLRCSNCQKSYDSDGGIIDLTLPNEGFIPQGTSFFQNPLVAFIYERGYRDVFAIYNFPGFNEEANMAQERLEPARGETIIDLSCGPGGFTRRFLVGGEYKTVIAADYSLAMLEQCGGFLEDDPSADLSKVVLVRADAARLPFETGSVAGVHAAAAIHCWPNVLSSVAEISRVLRPGGVFVASTFLLPAVGPFNVKSVRKAVDQLQLSVSWFTEDDLRTTTEACGLVNWYSYKRGIYILFSASKPI
ncbi:unnamed protein product [Calypogeia fissa]